MHKFKLTFIIFIMHVAVEEDSCETVFDFISCIVKLNPSYVSHNKNKIYFNF